MKDPLHSWSDIDDVTFSPSEDGSFRVVCNPFISFADGVLSVDVSAHLNEVNNRYPLSAIITGSLCDIHYEIGEAVLKDGTAFLKLYGPLDVPSSIFTFCVD